jgi:hypothetical protein
MSGLTWLIIVVVVLVLIAVAVVALQARRRRGGVIVDPGKSPNTGHGGPPR